jgi:hypothetical protein
MGGIERRACRDTEEPGVGEIRLGASGLAAASPLKFSAAVGRELRQRVAVSTTPCPSQNATRFGCPDALGCSARPRWRPGCIVTQPPLILFGMYLQLPASRSLLASG